MLLPELAAAFGPDLIVSQHGADSHAWDPLAHLRVTTTAMGEAARLVDRLAHGYAGGRWLATGGGGYDAYRVVPRSWSLVWLAGAHREVPAATPVEWRERWATEGARYGQAPLPATFEDAPNAGLELDASQAVAEARSLETVGVVRRLVVPRLLQVARDRGWWDPLAAAVGARGRARPRRLPGVGRPAIIHPDASTWERLTLAPRVVAPFDPVAGHALIARRDPRRRERLGRGRRDAGRRARDRRPDRRPRPPRDPRRSAWRRRSGSAGLAGALLEACVTAGRPGDTDYTAEVTLAERDPVEPLDRALRADIARRLLERAGFEIGPADADLRRADSGAFSAVRPALHV